MDKKTIFSVVVGAYALAIFSKLLPALSPSAVASYVPSIGGGKSDA